MYECNHVIACIDNNEFTVACKWYIPWLMLHCTVHCTGLQHIVIPDYISARNVVWDPHSFLRYTISHALKDVYSVIKT